MVGELGTSLPAEGTFRVLFAFPELHCCGCHARTPPLPLKHAGLRRWRQYPRCIAFEQKGSLILVPRRSGIYIIRFLPTPTAPGLLAIRLIFFYHLGTAPCCFVGRLLPGCALLDNVLARSSAPDPHCLPSASLITVLYAIPLLSFWDFPALRVVELYFGICAVSSCHLKPPVKPLWHLNGTSPCLFQGLLLRALRLLFLHQSVVGSSAAPHRSNFK